LLQVLPDQARLHGHGQAFFVHRKHLAHAPKIHRDAALDRQDAAIAGGGLAARDERDAVLRRPADQFHDLLLAFWLDNCVGRRFADQRFDQWEHHAHVVAVDLALHQIGSAPVLEALAQPRFLIRR
jgi:hypothetical protein